MRPTFIKQAVFTSAFLALFAIANAQQSGSANSSTTTKEKSYHNSEITREGDSRIHFERDGKEYYMKMVGDQVTELTIDGKTIAAADMGQYKELIDSMKEQLAKDRAQAEADRKQAALDRIQAEKDRAQAVKDRAQADKDRQQAQRDRERAEKDRDRVNGDREQAQRDRAQADKDRQQANRDRAQAEKDREQAVKDRAQAEIDRKHAEEDRAMIQSLLETAVKDGLATNADAITRLELSDDGFWINGKKQSDEMYKKYKAAYLKKPGAHLSMNRNYSGTSISL